MKVIKKIAIVLLTLWTLPSIAMQSSNKNSSIPEDKIVRLVFMGKTGAGKSTSINAFYNFAKGTKWNDYPKLFPIKTNYQACNVPEYFARNAEDHAKGQLGAVTQEPSEYEASGSDLIIKLIDCPGTADPRGVEQDSKITNDIAKFLVTTGNFNAICIVLNGSMNRATVEEKYFIEQLKTIIPKSSQDRIFILLTNATMATQNVKDFAESVGLPITNIFAFDHFALSREGHLNLSENEEIEDELMLKWKKSKMSFDKLIAKAQSLGKYSSGPMGRISEIKNSTSAKIATAFIKVNKIKQTAEKIEVAKSLLETAQKAHELANDQKKSTDKLVEVAKAAKQLKDAVSDYENYDIPEEYITWPILNTHCFNCATVCHAECGLEYKGENYTDHLSGCACIQNGYCTQCRNKCGYGYHRHKYTAWRTVTKTREKHGVKEEKEKAANYYNKTIEELNDKQKQLDDKANVMNIQNKDLVDAQTCLDNLKIEKDELQNQIIELYVELDKVSMSSISFQIGEYYDKCIKDAGNDSIKVAKLLQEKQFYIEQVELYKKKVGNI